MKASKFTDAQKAFILKQAEEGAPVGDVCRKAGMRWLAGELTFAEKRPGDFLFLAKEVCRDDAA